MTTRNESNDIAERLLAAERAQGTATERPAEPAAAFDPSFEHLLENERRFEQRLRQAILASWAVAFVCLVSIAAGIFVVRNGGGTFVEVTRSALLVFTVTGIVSLFAGAVSSLAWLLRARTPTLRAIERRLAALERLLATRR